MGLGSPPARLERRAAAGEGSVDAVQRLLAHAVRPPELDLRRARRERHRHHVVAGLERHSLRLALPPFPADRHRPAPSLWRKEVDGSAHLEPRVASVAEGLHRVFALVEGVRDDVRDGRGAHGREVHLARQLALVRKREWFVSRDSVC